MSSQPIDSDAAYRDVLASLPEGVIVTFNNSDPTQSGTDELTVDRAAEDGEIGLVGLNGSHWVVQEDNREGKLALFESDDEWPEFYEPITTIEIVGIQ